MLIELNHHVAYNELHLKRHIYSYIQRGERETVDKLEIWIKKREITLAFKVSTVSYTCTNIHASSSLPCPTAYSFLVCILAGLVNRVRFLLL